MSGLSLDTVAHLLSSYTFGHRKRLFTPSSYNHDVCFLSAFISLLITNYVRDYWHSLQFKDCEIPGQPYNSILIEMWLFHVIGISRMYRAVIGEVSLLYTTVSESRFPSNT